MFAIRQALNLSHWQRWDDERVFQIIDFTCLPTQRVFVWSSTSSTTRSWNPSDGKLLVSTFSTLIRDIRKSQGNNKLQTTKYPPGKNAHIKNSELFRHQSLQGRTPADSIHGCQRGTFATELFVDDRVETSIWNLNSSPEDWFTIARAKTRWTRPWKFYWYNLRKKFPRSSFFQLNGVLNLYKFYAFEFWKFAPTFIQD